VIEDIEGATSEPTRRGHVVVLSGAVAIASLALLLTLVAPAPHAPAPVDTARYAASPAPSPGGAAVMMLAPNPVSRMRVDLSRTTTCSDGTPIGPPYVLSIDGASPGRVFIVFFDEGTGAQTRSPIPAAFRFDARTGWMTVTCATDDLLAR
jgi:hypothetical protein